MLLGLDVWAGNGRRTPTIATFLIYSDIFVYLDAGGSREGWYKISWAVLQILLRIILLRRQLYIIKGKSG